MGGSKDLAGHRIHWSMRVGWRSQADGTRQFDLNLWMLDPETGEVPDALVLTMAEGQVIRLVPSVPRVDALRARKLPEALWPKARLCGFKGIVETGAAAFAVQIEIAGTAHDLGTIKVGSVTVLEGRNGWLFLAGDTNDSPAQYSRNYRPEADWLAGWRSYFDGMETLAKTQPGIRSLSFLVAPSKETVLGDVYPLPPAKYPLIDVFLSEFGNRPGFFWPAPVLAPHRDYAFDKAETHWTDFGARLTCEALLKRWTLTPAQPPARYRLEEGRGDLGDKMMPAIRALRPSADWPNPAELVFDNFALHHGNIKIWQNPTPAIDETLMIFGGSSADYMVRYLSAIFARVVSVYTAGVPDPALVALERPARVILQTSQRFLTQPAARQTDVFATARSKIEKNLLTIRGSHAKEMERWHPAAGPAAGIETYLQKTPVVA
ncbi:hypothetical protein D2T31_03950 [Sinirhodobacter populi]|uniref:AlgX/AlgJ SGNH hydrolase-like domain-containing protein n=1 Tax=Paenirhodobacter populi TaxID=2306993 RepID=A0A443KFN9_9RHOB|nr:hypothetical protein [Sinirhodobacter populi]RWR31568.1 hypothetical protein D2T31_03950 [Sinirhodobacter populi]